MINYCVSLTNTLCTLWVYTLCIRLVHESDCRTIIRSLYMSLSGGEGCAISFHTKFLYAGLISRHAQKYLSNDIKAESCAFINQQLQLRSLIHCAGVADVAVAIPMSNKVGLSHTINWR